MPHLIDTSALQHFIHPRARERWPGLVERIAGVIEQDGALHLSAVTVFEVRRGLRVLELQGTGRVKRSRFELLLRQSVVLGLSNAWSTATDLYAAARVHKPAINLSDADLLIAATAFAADHVFVTSDRRLAKNLETLGYGRGVISLDLA